MLICLKCRKEMVCVHTGLTLHFHDGHCYPSDAFQCPTCKTVITKTGASGYHASDEALDAMSVTGDLFEMEAQPLRPLEDYLR